MNDDNSKKLYDALSNDYDMGTYDKFVSDIQDKTKRQNLYDAIKEDYDLPDFDGFSKQLGFDNTVTAPAGTISNDTAYIDGNTFTQEQLDAMENGTVNTVEQGVKAPAKFGTPEYGQEVIQDDLPDNPYVGMTRQQAVNTIGQKFRNEWYGKPGAYDNIKTELATYNIAKPEDYGHITAAIRNHYVNQIANQRVQQLLSGIESINSMNIGDIQRIMDSRETQQAIEEDLKHLGIRANEGAYENTEDKQKELYEYQREKDAYYEMLNKLIEDKLVNEYGYLPSNDGRSHAREFAASIMPSGSGLHEERIRQREASDLVSQYTDPFVREYFDKAYKKAEAATDAIVNEGYTTISPSMQMGRYRNAWNENTDPERIWNNIKPNMEQMIEKISSDKDFLEAASIKAEQEGLELPAYMNKRVIPYVMSLIAGEFERMAVEKEMPKNFAQYAEGKMRDSLVGMLLNAAVTSQIRRRAQQKAMQRTDMGIGVYKPSFGERVAGGALGMAPDLALYGLAGKTFGSFGQGLTQTINSTGVRPIVGRLVSSGVTGGFTMGSVGALEGGVEGTLDNPNYGNITEEDYRSLMEILGDSFDLAAKKGTRSFVGGLTMVGGPVGQKIANGRGIIGNLLGWGTQTGIDAAGATAVSVISGDIRPEDIGIHFAENLGTFAALGLQHKVKEFTSLANGGKSWNGVDFSKKEIQTLEDYGLDKFRNILRDIEYANNRGGLIEKSLVGQDTKESVRKAVESVGAEFYNDLMKSYTIDRDLKIKVAQAIGAPIPYYVMRPEVLDLTLSIPAKSTDQKFTDSVNEEYNKEGGVADKTKNGEELSRHDLTIRLLFQDNKQYNEILEKQKSGQSLTDEEAEFANTYNKRIAEVQRDLYKQERARINLAFEMENGLQPGTMDLLLRDVRDGRAIDSNIMKAYESYLREQQETLDKVDIQQQEEAAKVQEAEMSAAENAKPEDVQQPGTQEYVPQEGDPGIGEVFQGADGRRYMALRIPDENGNISWKKMLVGEDGEPTGDPIDFDQAEYEASKTIQNEPEPHLVVDENGEPLFEQSPVEATIKSLVSEFGEAEAANMVNDEIADLNSSLNELTSPANGKGKKISNMNERRKKMLAIKDTQAKLAYWKQVRDVMVKPEEVAPQGKTAQPIQEELAAPQQPIVNREPDTPSAPPVEPQQPIVNQEPLTPPTPPTPPAELTAEQKVAIGTVKKNMDKRFGFRNEDGTRSEIVIDVFKGDDKVTVTRQDYDAEGHPVGEPYKQDLNLIAVSNSIIKGVMKPAQTTEEKLAKVFKVKVGDVKLIDVLTEDEMQQLLDLYEKGDKEAIGNLTGELRNAHEKDLILKGRDIRNEKTRKGMSKSGKGERLRSVREQYKAFDNALSYLSDESMQPSSPEEWVAELLGEPKNGTGNLAYYSYGEGDNKVIGLKDESGFGKRGFDGDTKGFNPWLAPNGKGMSLKQFAESIHSQMPESVQQQVTDQDVRNIILNILSGAEKPSDITNYILQNRLNQAEAEAQYMEDTWMDNPSLHKVSANDTTFSGRLTKAKQQTNTEPTEAQKEAGNYKKGHISFGGYDFVVENPEGSMRRGKDANGKEWEQKMNNTYGYILGKKGKDGDHLDMFIYDAKDLDNWNGNVYVVDQRRQILGKDNKPTGEWEFDEHKIMYGFDSEEEARDAYLSNYEKGWQGLGSITGVPKEVFDKWLDSSDRKVKPFSDHSIVKNAEAQTGSGNHTVTDAEIDTATRDNLENIISKAGVKGVEIVTDIAEAEKISNKEADGKNTGTKKFFKTPDGDAYGFAYNGKIYIDNRIATSETPIHEYGHLWAEMKRQTAPKEWDDIKNTLLCDRMIEPFIEKVKSEYPELNKEGMEDDFVEEILTQFSGRYGAEKLRQVAAEIKEDMGGDATASVIAETAIRRVKSVLDKFWKGVADMMGWKYTSAEDIADRILYDLLNGVNPREEILKAKENIASQQDIKPAKVIYLNAKSIKMPEKQIEDYYTEGLTPKDSINMSNRVNNMSPKELVLQYKRLNDQMLDENGLNVDEQEEAFRQKWFSEHGIEGFGKASADFFKQQTDKYSYNKMALRWDIEDRIKELGLETYIDKDLEGTVNIDDLPDKRETAEIVRMQKATKSDKDHKKKQLEIVTKENPMQDDYHTGIRSIDDIKTFKEVYEEGKKEAANGGWNEYASNPDITNEMIEEALKTGKIVVYSSYPINNGTFVTPSLMMAKDYAGNGRVYPRKVALDDVAWINLDEGQYANLKEAPKFQMVGKRGAENADWNDRDTKRMDNLKLAEEAEKAGHDAHEIKFATGWERGKDGKWRYETMDAKADIVGAFENEYKIQNLKLRELGKKQNDLQKKFERLNASIPSRLDSRYSEEQKAKYRQMRKEREDAWKEYRKASDEYDKYKDEMKEGGVKLSLGGILGYDNELFKYYPDFKDIPVILSSNMDSGTAGSFDGETIKLNINELNRFRERDLANENVMGTLIHEIQHAVQDEEGFAQGGNLYTSTTEEGINAIIAKKMRQKERIKQSIDANKVYLNSEEDLQFAAELDGRSLEEERKFLREENEKLSDEYYTLDLYIKKIQHDKAPSMSDARELYNNLAGEVEARNATRRMDMSEEERMTHTLEETESVHRNDQVVIMGKGALSSNNLKEPVNQEPLTDKEIEEAIENMKSIALKEPFVEIKDENWKEHINTPLGDVKMGENQRTKLFVKGRESQYGMLLDTLENPNIILEEKDKKEDPKHERYTSYLFIKTFLKPDGTKYHHFMSVTVSQQGQEVSISSHILRNNQLKDKLKNDRLLYKATALDKSANLSAEQPIKGGSLSSGGKDTKNINSLQEKSQKSSGKDLVDQMLDEVERRKNLGKEPKFQKVSQQPVFFSNAMKAVENIKQDKATPEQWLKMIEKAGGLKAGEDKWIGLSDFLKEHKGKTITKEEVMDFIRKNQIQVEEVNYIQDVDMLPTIEENIRESIGNGKSIEELQSEVDANAESADRYDTLGENPDMDDLDEYLMNCMAHEYGDDFRQGYSIIDGDIQYNIDPYDLDEDAFNIRFAGDGNRAINGTRLGYTTKGLKNNKEIALTVPTIEPYNEDDQIHFGDAGEGRAIAWARFGETTDADGNRILVTDEIQSKRHQDAREKGYRDNLQKEKVAEMKAAEKKARDYGQSMKNKYNANNYPGEWKLLATKEEVEEFDNLFDKYVSLMEELDYDKWLKGIPAAPFEKNWHELAMKRMLRYAAENGYDKMAWTTGEQQAERYNIGNVVNKIITYDYPEVNDPDGRKTKKIEIRLKDGMTMTMRVDQNGKVIEGRSDTEGKQLSDIVGKDLAKSIMNGDGKDGSIYDANKDLPAKIIEGEGLRIGGEGMKSFYDQILPRFIEKYCKKWGVKPETIDLPEIHQKMWSIDITPEMKESVMQGQPMFHKVESTPEAELTPEDRQYWNKWEKDMKKWKERNNLPENATVPVEPKMEAGESVLDYAKRVRRYAKEKAVWQTAPRLDDYRTERLNKDILEDARENEKNYPDSQSAKMRRVAAEFRQISAAVSKQKAYDKATVKAVTDFANDYMKMGFGDNLTRGEVERLLSAVKNATGAKDIRSHVDNIMNILTDNYLRNLENQVTKLSSVKELGKTVQGVEKQGKLELKGQRMIQEFRKALQERMSVDDIRERMAEVYQYMARNDEESPMWEQEYEGLDIALQYAENIDGSRSEWKALDDAYRDAIKNYQESGRTYEQQQQYLEELNKAKMENKMERIGKYNEIIRRLQGNIAESVEGAKEFVQRKKERVRHIQDIANYDLAGKDMGVMREKVKGKHANFFLQPLATFEQMLKQFGSRNANGEGYLYNYFVRSWMDANEKAFTNEKESKKELDEKAREVFGDEVKRWSDLYKLTRNEKEFPGMDVEVIDVNGKKSLYLTQGNLLYIYMADKMTDGAMKLRKMGITEEDVRAIEEHLDPRLVQLGDWLQDEFLVKKRTEYNKVHERMFGAPMAAIDHYFPIKILGDARVQEQDVNVPDSETLPSTITGNIIKRRRNTLPLDILHTDALSLTIEHIEDMDRWAATAEWNQDVNTLLSYTTFRNKVKNMKTIYGSGDALWNTFKDAARIAAGTYNPSAKAGHTDQAISNIAKGVTAAKINFRMYTALKQLLSTPAFVHDVDMKYFVKNAANLYGSWKWAMENMPIFEKRWKSRQAGDTRLMDDPSDWKMWKTDIVQMATRLGMSTNALVDGVTCAVGARSIYESRLKKYLDMGVSEEVANKRALQDAKIGYNLTQQSSEGAFVSAIQKDRTVAANALSVFRNSSMAYTRQWVDAARNLKHRTEKGYKEDSIRFMKDQIMNEFGLDEEAAQAAAEREYARAARHDVARMLNMMFGVTIAWNLGASLPYIFIGDDWETKKEMMTDALLKGLTAGPTEGFAAGNIFSELVGRSLSEDTRKAFKEEGIGAAVDTGFKQASDYEINPLPLLADIQGIIDKMGYDKWAAAQDVFNLCAQSAVGVNPQTLTDMWNAFVDYGNPTWVPFVDNDKHNQDLANSKEIALFVMRLMNAPTSSWRNKYIDELDMNVEDAKKLSYEELAQRYANYKHWKDAPFTGWFRDDEAEQKKLETIRKQFDKAYDQRLGRQDDGELKDLVDNHTGDFGLRERVVKEAAKRLDSADNWMDSYKATDEGENEKDGLDHKAGLKNYIISRSWKDIVEDLEIEKAKRIAKEKDDKDALSDHDFYEKDVKVWMYELGTEPVVSGGTTYDDAKRLEEIRDIRKQFLEKVRSRDSK